MILAMMTWCAKCVAVLTCRQEWWGIKTALDIVQVRYCITEPGQFKYAQTLLKNQNSEQKLLTNIWLYQIKPKYQRHDCTLQSLMALQLCVQSYGQAEYKYLKLEL